MKKWVAQLTFLEQLLKRSLLKRKRSASVINENKLIVSKAEEAVSRYEKVREAIKKTRQIRKG